MDAIRARTDAEVWDDESAIPREELLRRVAGKRGAVTLLTERVDDEFLDAAGPDLLIVANYAVGFDNIDVPALTNRGVMATNTPDVLTETTADTAWALLMAAARRVPEGDRFLRTGTEWIWGPEMMLGQDIHGKTLGVVGFGRIGQAVAGEGRGSACGSSTTTCTTRPRRSNARWAQSTGSWTNCSPSPTSSPSTSPSRRTPGTCSRRISSGG
jgi:glyoxylate reductase